MVLDPIVFIVTFSAGAFFALALTFIVIDNEKINARNKHYRDLIEKIANKLDVQ
jgi:hypothetical protein